MKKKYLVNQNYVEQCSNEVTTLTDRKHEAIAANLWQQFNGLQYQ